MNNEEFLTLLCSPDHLEYLVHGFLKSEGIILKAEDVLKLSIEKDKGFAFVELKNKNNLSEALQGKRIMTTGCGKGSTFYNVLDLMHVKALKDDYRVSISSILSLSNQLNHSSELFQTTGGVHSCCVKIRPDRTSS